MIDTKELIKNARIIADSIHVHSSFQDWEAAEKDTLEQCADALEAADKRIAEMERNFSDVCNANGSLACERNELLNDVREIEEQMPKEGVWIWENYCWHCSVCGENPTRGMGYVQGKDELFRACPNCGARMKKK